MSRRRNCNKAVNKNVFWNVALYIRLSREDGNDESLSIGNQKKILMEYVNQNFSDEYEVKNLYIDDGLTGTDTDRPGFKQMEQDIKNKTINCVIVKALSRAFRNIGDQSKFLDEFLPLYSVRFISIGSPFIDTYNNSRSTLGFEVPMYGMFNEQFAASTSEEVRKTFNTKRRQGEFIGAFAPYGYLKSPENKNNLIIDENSAVVIKDIFNWYLYGINNNDQTSLSINGIARELNERGIPCPAKYKEQCGLNYKNPHNKYKEVFWTHTTVYRILKERMYIGDMVQGRFRTISYKIHKQIKTPEDEWFIVENTHEAIISKEMFETTQKQLLKDTRAPIGKKEVYLFSGFLNCAECGRALHRKKSKGIVYYFCRTNQSAKGKCSNHSMREDRLFAVVIAAIKSQISLVIDLTAVIDKINKSPKANNNSSRLINLLKTQEQEMAKINNVCDSLYLDWKNGDITKNEYLRMKSSYLKKQEALQTSINKTQNECMLLNKGIDESNPFFDEFIKHRNISTLTREVLSDLVENIIIHENGEVTIRFNFTDQYQLIMDFIENNTNLMRCV